MIHQISSIECNSNFLIVYENYLGGIDIGKIEEIAHIQMERQHIDKVEVQNFILTPNDDFLVTIDQWPNFEFVKFDNEYTNSITLYNKNNFKKYSQFFLEKEEAPNCIFFCSKAPFTLPT